VLGRVPQGAGLDKVHAVVARLAAAHADLDGMRVLQRRGQLGGWVRRELGLTEMLEARLLGALERELGTEVPAAGGDAPERAAAEPAPRARATAQKAGAGKTGASSEGSLGASVRKPAAPLVARAGDALASAQERREETQEVVDKGKEAAGGFADAWRELDKRFDLMGKAAEGIKSVSMVKDVCKTLGGLGSAALQALEKAPFVGPIAVIASGIVGALVEASEVRANCQELDELVMRAVQITLEAQAGIERCRGALEELLGALEGAQELVGEVSKRGGLGRFLKGGADNRKVAEARERIEKAMAEVTAAAAMETRNEVRRLGEGARRGGGGRGGSLLRRSSLVRRDRESSSGSSSESSYGCSSES